MLDGSWENITAAEIRSFCRDRGVHIWCDSDTVVHGCGRYLFVHSGDNDAPVLNIPDGMSLIPLFEDAKMSRLYRIDMK